jgi:site-specific recombinase XerD
LPAELPHPPKIRQRALLFLYREVLQIELPWLDSVEQAKTLKRVPVVLTQEEVHALLSRLQGTPWLITSLLYGGGLRIMEGVRLPIKNVDLIRHEILVRDGKGHKDRVTMLPAALVKPLINHLADVKVLHLRDLSAAGREAGSARC